MAWTSTQVFTALTAKWYSETPDATEIVRHVEVSPHGGLPGSGVGHRDLRFHTSGGTSDPASSSVVMQELAELYKSYDANNPSLMVVDAGDWWWGAFEVGSNPSAAGNIQLRWLELDGANQTQSTTVSVTPGADAQATAEAILAALETIAHVNDASLRVVNGRGAMFYAWVTTGGSSNVPTVLVLASSHRQKYARVLNTLTGVTSGYIYGTTDSTLLASNIEDPASPWGPAMDAGNVAAKDFANAAGGTTSVVPTRGDVTVQGSVFRSDIGAKMTTSNKVKHAEVIAPALPRTVVIEINHSDFSSASGTMSRTINIDWPFNDRLGFDYFGEGTPVIIDAFLELGTAWQVDSSGTHSGTYPSVTMDIGMSAPVLIDADGRMTTGALLRGVRLTENATQGYNLGGGYAPVNQFYQPAAETFHGASQSNHSGNATEWIEWGEVSKWRVGTVTYIEASEPTILQYIVFEPTTAYAPDGSNYTTFQIYVCPRNTEPTNGNFVALNTYLDLTAAPYNCSARWDSTGTYTPLATAAGQQRPDSVGLLIPAGWKIAIEQRQYGHGGIADFRDWEVKLLTHAHRQRGPLLMSSSSMPVVDPFGDRDDTLTATINIEGKTELQVGPGAGVTEPGTTTFDLASLDQGTCYLHVRYWQPRRVGTQRDYATES